MIYFLQNNLNSFDQVTLNKMAKESFSSTSSVLRFCKNQDLMDLKISNYN